MPDPRKAKLMSVSKEDLVDAILDLAIRYEPADAKVDHLIATPAEAYAEYFNALKRLKDGIRFVSWKGAHDLAYELSELLRSVDSVIKEPCTGTEFVAEFYTTDDGVLGNCDDSNGAIGDVYRHDAKELFVKYATLCQDKKRLADLVMKINEKDDYGIRDTLVDKGIPSPC